MKKYVDIIFHIYEEIGGIRVNDRIAITKNANENDKNTANRTVDSDVLPSDCITFVYLNPHPTPREMAVNATASITHRIRLTVGPILNILPNTKNSLNLVKSNVSTFVISPPNDNLADNPMGINNIIIPHIIKY